MSAPTLGFYPHRIASACASNPTAKPGIRSPQRIQQGRRYPQRIRQSRRYPCQRRRNHLRRTPAQSCHPERSRRALRLARKRIHLTRLPYSGPTAPFALKPNHPSRHPCRPMANPPPEDSGDETKEAHLVVNSEGNSRTRRTGGHDLMSRLPVIRAQRAIDSGSG